jgi:hypothetical protein
MNKRIKELAEQAATRFEQDMDGSMEPEESGDWIRFEDLEKFAELIVKECGEFVDPVTRNLMFKHLGIEE